jgi:hypothetical protein
MDELLRRIIAEYFLGLTIDPLLYTHVAVLSLHLYPFRVKLLSLSASWVGASGGLVSFVSRIT